MKWQMDVHKYFGEVTKTALKVLASFEISNSSSEATIKKAEQKLADLNVYKDYNAANGRIRRALLTYFKAYKCINDDCSLTEMGKVLVEDRITIREFCFWYVANYKYSEQNKEYYPLELILKYIIEMKNIDADAAFLTVSDFYYLNECNSAEDITTQFVKTTLEKRNLAEVNIDNRAIGFDVWMKMLVQAEILEKINSKKYILKNDFLAQWILSSYEQGVEIIDNKINTGIISYIPTFTVADYDGINEDVMAENIAVYAFLFDEIEDRVIDKYIIKNKTNNIEKIKNSLGLDNTAKAFYKNFDGYSYLVGYSLLGNENKNLKCIGGLLTQLHNFEDMLEADENDDWQERLWKDLTDETIENKTWIFMCLEKLKEYGVLNNEVLKKLLDFEYCKKMFKLYHTPVLTLEVDSTNSDRVYVNEKFTLNSKEQFFVSKEWKNQDGNRNRNDFTTWVLKHIEYRFRTLNYNTNVTSNYPLNRIIFGAPGTGKSNRLLKQTESLIGKGRKPERVTFHPDYTYANFVGTYKPVPAKDEDGKDIITYKYIPGPFMRMLVKALLNSEQAHLLIIEEINRANVAAVFGDVFQLLDRDAKGVSEYAIQTSEDMRKYLSEALNIDSTKVESIKIPNNLFLWATMNSADQGVYPMDTAFKRRWDFEYIDIDNNDKDINHYWFEVAGVKLHWNSLRKAINKELTDNGINEDKLMGAFFVSKNVIDENNNEKFIEAFCNKVIMYLFEDAVRQKPGRIFKLDNNKTRYSALCKDFEKNGINIFVASIVEEYKNLVDAQSTTTNQEQTVEATESVE